MKNRSVSVTGATGFVGSHIAERFRADGWDVRGIVRPGSASALPDGVARVTARLAAADLRRAFEGSELVVHSAAQLRARDERSLIDVNVGGTHAVVAAANAVGSRLILISSQAAIGPSPEGRAAREDDPPRPVNAYGRSKWEAEEAVRSEAKVPWTILRPSSVYGPRDRQFLPLFRLGARGRFLVAAPPDASFTLVHVHDVARAVIAAAATATSEPLFVGYRVPATSLDVLRAIATAVDRPFRPTFVPKLAVTLVAYAGELAWRIGATPLLDRARLTELRAGSFVCSTRRATERIGFTAAIPLEEGFATTWRWYRENGWI